MPAHRAIRKPDNPALQNVWLTPALELAHSIEHHAAYVRVGGFMVTLHRETLLKLKWWIDAIFAEWEFADRRAAVEARAKEEATCPK